MAQRPSASADSAPRPVRVEPGQRRVAEFVEVPAVDRVADVVEQLDEEPFVVDRRQRESVEFPGAQRMVHVGARIVRARVAVASLFQGAEIGLELGALDVVPAVARENRAIAAAPRRGDAVEGVAAVLHAGEDVVHGGDAEHVARPVLRHRIADPRARIADDALLDRAADAHAVEVQRRDLLGRMPAQILVVRALHHAVQRLIRLADPLLRQPPVLGHAALRPAIRALHRLLLIRARIHQRGQLVEREHDVRADLMLDAHRDFG